MHLKIPFLRLLSSFCLLTILCSVHLIEFTPLPIMPRSTVFFSYRTLPHANSGIGHDCNVANELLNSGLEQLSRWIRNHPSFIALKNPLPSISSKRHSLASDICFDSTELHLTYPRSWRDFFVVGPLLYLSFLCCA